MTFIKTPVKGMPEQLPNEMAVREYALRTIKDTYAKFGFMLIETPQIEHIENLTSKQGGENEQLIFKILKRGDKLANSTASDLCDSGLRYDLTLPLARFYANNIDVLPTPFKAMQIGYSFRADRPQKGRFRQLMQCDIDVLGDATNLAEIELITATVTMLNALGLKRPKVRVNDRAILKAMALNCGFGEELLSDVFIILDKMDKIGLDGVKKELTELGLDAENVNKYCNYFTGLSESTGCKDFIAQKVGNAIDNAVVENLSNIIDAVRELVPADNAIIFDPTLVRGMGYYTGPIFEIEMQDYNLSVAGGGRYDKMIGQFSGQDVYACGFSIGFERIMQIILENNLLQLPTQEKIAVLVDKNAGIQKIKQTMQKANELRSQGVAVMVLSRNNNVRFQKEKLTNFGVTKFVEIFADKGEL